MVVVAVVVVVVGVFSTASSPHRHHILLSVLQCIVKLIGHQCRSATVAVVVTVVIIIHADVGVTSVTVILDGIAIATSLIV